MLREGARGPPGGSASRSGWALLYREETSGLVVVDLQGRVSDPETVIQQLLQLFPDLVAVVAGADEDVGRQGGEARGDLPHVQVVDVGDARVGDEALADLAGLHPDGGGFEEDPARV